MLMCLCTLQASIASLSHRERCPGSLLAPIADSLAVSLAPPLITVLMILLSLVLNCVAACCAWMIANSTATLHDIICHDEHCMQQALQSCQIQHMLLLQMLHQPVNTLKA